MAMLAATVGIVAEMVEVENNMKEYFTFENAPLTIVWILIAWSWISALSVIFFH
jgi:hypothetical protein